MNRKGNQLTISVPDPFDGSAHIRLKRMGLLDSDGCVPMRGMAAFAIIFTALFFDDLCESHDADDILTIYGTFKALSEKGDYQHMYLLMSILYDYMKKSLPDPVWWLAGDSEAVTAFMTMFMGGFERILKSEGIIKPGEGVRPQ